MANTNILIKRSGTTRTPVSLGAGEFAYSYASDTLFLGNAAGNGVINVGGLLYTQTIDAATTANTGGTLVKRDADGKFSGRLTGIADKADQLTNARNFSISGHDITAASVSFDGTGAVVLDASLNQVPGLSAGTYGSTTQIPSVTVGANGRVIAITTNNVATDLEIRGDSGNTTINLLSDLFSLRGGQGLTSTASGIAAEGIITFDVDNTVVRANTPITIQTIDGNVQISGNLTVLGTEFITNTTSLNIADPLIYLASNNYSSDIVDIGYVGNYYDGSSQRHAGVFRHAGTKEFYIFDNYGLEPHDNTIDVANTDFRLATVNANLKSNLITSTAATIGTLTLNNALTVPNGGTGKTSFSTGQVLIGSGTNGLTQLSNVSSISESSISSNSSVSSFITDVYGRVTTFGTQPIAGLTVAQGGTGRTTFSEGSIVIGNAAGGLLTLANTTYTQTGSFASNNTITSVTVDAYGRFTAATVGAISGLTVPQGGTGATSFTTNGITYGNGSGTIQVTAAAGTADQTWSNQVLTTTNAGVPVWTTALDGGTF
jgi:hypothetical protein